MQITDEAVEAFGNAAREQFGLPPATYDEMVKARPDVVANIRRNLEAALPLIRAGVVEECAKRYEQGDDWDTFSVAATAIRKLGAGDA
jgi:hypothetical protein